MSPPINSTDRNLGGDPLPSGQRVWAKLAGLGLVPHWPVGCSSVPALLQGCLLGGRRPAKECQGYPLVLLLLTPAFKSRPSHKQQEGVRGATVDRGWDVSTGFTGWSCLSHTEPDPSSEEGRTSPVLVQRRAALLAKRATFLTCDWRVEKSF